MATVLGKEQLDRAAHRLWVEVVVRCPFDLRGAPVGAAHLPYLLVLVDGQGHERFALPRPGGVVEGSRHARRCCGNLEGENSLSLDFELVDFPERHAVVSVPGNLPLERLEFVGLSLRYAVPQTALSLSMPKRSHASCLPLRTASLLSAEKYLPRSLKLKSCLASLSSTTSVSYGFSIPPISSITSELL